MLMRKDSASRLVVVLQPDDMEELDITFAKFDYKNEKTREIISDLLQKAREEHDFNRQGKRLTIEVYPMEGGCEIIFEAADRDLPAEEDPKKSLTAFRFAGSEELYSCLEKVGHLVDQMTLSAALYLVDNQYIAVFLSISTQTQKLRNILKEFADDLGEDPQFLSRLDEYYPLLISCRSLTESMLRAGAK